MKIADGLKIAGVLVLFVFVLGLFRVLLSSPETPQRPLTNPSLIGKAASPSLIDMVTNPPPTPIPEGNRFGSVEGRAEFVRLANNLDPLAKIVLHVAGAQNEVLMMDATASPTTICEEFESPSEVGMRAKYKGLGFIRVVYFCVGGKREVDLN
jgi:hypothetical protein